MPNKLAEWMTRHWLRTKALPRRRQLDRDLADEVEFHLAMRERKLTGEGVEADAARYAAQRSFGNAVRAQETNRELRSFPWIESFWHDLRYAARQLRRSPGYAATVVGILAVGLAATAAIFSVVNGAILQPLAYAHPSELVALELYVPKMAAKFPLLPLNPATYVSWTRAKALAGISLIDEGESFNLTGQGEPALVSTDAVTSNLFRLLGVTPRLGRAFLPHAEHEAILTNALWHSRFEANPEVIGREIRLNGSPYTIVGVLPASFHFPVQNELVEIDTATPAAGLFVPLDVSKLDLKPGEGFGYAAIARLRAGTSREAAAAELDALLRRQFGHMPSGMQPTASVVPLRDAIVHSARQGLWLLLAAVLAVLLVICVNLANLSLARDSARQHEAAIRSALGAGRARLLRQCLAESVLLGLLGGGLGLALAHWALRALMALAPAGLPRAHNVHLDGTVFACTLAAGLTAGLLAGLLPAWRRAHSQPQDALRSAGTRTGTGAGEGRARAWLVGMETALSMMLLVAAGLLLTSFLKLVRVPAGFAVQHVLTANLQLPAAAYAERGQRQSFWRQVLTAAAELPGVKAAAVTSWLPLHGEMNDDAVTVPGDSRPNAEQPFASYRRVSPGFFRALDIPLVRGRLLTSADVGKPVVVISEATAEEVWPGQNPVGRLFDAYPGFTGIRVVGVVGNTRAVSLMEGPAAMIYEPYGGGLAGALILRSSLPPSAVAAELRRAFEKIAPGVAVPQLRSMEQIVAASLAPRRFEALLIALFAGAALLLACLGIYGVVSYSVVRREREIGVRMALGARPRDVVGQIVDEGMRPALLGLGAGLIGALGLMRALTSLLYGVQPADPVVFGAAAAVLAGVALLACTIPARRAARADPAVALREG